MNAQQTTGPTDHRALLSSIGDRLVRRVAASDDRFAQALFAVVLQRKRDWQAGEWAAVLEELDTSELTVCQFLNAEHQRARQ